MPRSYHWSIARHHISLRKLSAVRLVLLCLLCTIVCSGVVLVGDEFLSRARSHAERVSISLFMRPTVDTATISALCSDIRKDASIASFDVLSPDSVRNYFNDRYGVNVSEVLPINPFRTQIRLHLQPILLSADVFVAEVQQYRGLTELVEDVNYDADYVRAVLAETRATTIALITAAILTALLIISLLYFALRAENIYSSDDVSVVELLGGRPGFLKRSVTWRIAVLAIPGAILGYALSIVAIQSLNAQKLLSITMHTFQVPVLAAVFVTLLVLILSRRSMPIR